MDEVSEKSYLNLDLDEERIASRDSKGMALTEERKQNVVHADKPEGTGESV